MSSYHTSFTYLDKNSYEDFKLQIVHFESGDSGEVDSYLSQESIYTDSPRGTKRTLYGTKYNSVALLNVTIMRPNGDEFSIEKTREIYKWLTGATQYNWLDLYIGEEVKYRMFCFVQDIKPYKIDSRVVGFVITFEANSPWCYSPLQTVKQTLTGPEVITIDNQSDDVYTYTTIKTTFQNTGGNSLLITNTVLDETTEIYNLAINETVTLSENMFITSDNTSRVFGNDFNYIWPRLQSGTNKFTVNGVGNIIFEYVYCIKVGDCVGDLNAASDPVCDDAGNIILDTLDWGRISGKPDTLYGYGITDTYTKSQVDAKFTNLYTKTEVDALIASITIDEDELNAMLDEVLI